MEGKILIDFDGTIVEQIHPRSSDPTDFIGAIRDGAKEAICKLKDMGFEIIIASGRFDPKFPVCKFQRKIVIDFLVKNEIPFDDLFAKPRNTIAIIDDIAIFSQDTWDASISRVIRLWETK